MKKLTVFGCCIALSFGLHAQTGISNDNSAPDSSAMLDVKSTSRGMLVPRMTAAERDLISRPATGLLIFCISDLYFYMNRGTPESPEWYAIKSQWISSGSDIYFNEGSVGIGTSSPEFRISAENDGGIMAKGIHLAGKLLSTSGPGTRLIWYPRKAAFRAGGVTGDHWNNASIGNYSVAFGYNARANGEYSTAMGYNANANSVLAVAIGRNNVGGGSAGTWVDTDPLFEIGNGATSSNPANALTVLKNGNVGIGVSAPDARLVVAGQLKILGGVPGAGKVLTSDTDGLGSWQSLTPGGWTDDGTAVRLTTSSDRVGIGITSPDAELDVAGQVKIRGGNPGDGKLLTSDATGRATWEIPTSDLSGWIDEGSAVHTLTTTDKVGIGTSSPEFKLSLVNDGGILGKGSHGSGSTLTTAGSGTRMIWYPRKSAFRAGNVGSDQWNDANIGDYSAAFGYSPKASGSSSFAAGYNTTAVGDHASAFGYSVEADAYGCFAIGRYNVGGGDPENWTETDPLFEVGYGFFNLPLPLERRNALTVLKNGNVGIGMADPAEKLEVSGTIHSTDGGYKFPDGTVQTTAAWIPTGVILMWSGTTANIPDGWTLCDGSNGTPDLRERFIVGIGDNPGVPGGGYNFGASGGANNHTLTLSNLPAHSHTGTTASSGDHFHFFNDYIRNLTEDGGGSGLYCRAWCDLMTMPNQTASTGAHTHTFTTSTVGTGSAVDHRPPYYALCYIMKL